MARQQSFLPGFDRKIGMAFGGNLNIGRRKNARPFSHRLPIHVIFKSSRAKGRWSLQAHDEKVEKLLNKFSKLYGIQVFYRANVGNHLHLLLRTRSKSYPQAKAVFQAFLRRFSGELAFQVMQAKKGQPKGRFWDAIPFTRLINWGRDFATAKTYIFKNLIEAAGLWDRKAHPDWELIDLSRAPPHG